MTDSVCTENQLITKPINSAHITITLQQQKFCFRIYFLSHRMSHAFKFSGRKCSVWMAIHFFNLERALTFCEDCLSRASSCTSLRYGDWGICEHTTEFVRTVELRQQILPGNLLQCTFPISQWEAAQPRWQPRATTRRSGSQNDESSACRGFVKVVRWLCSGRRLSVPECSWNWGRRSRQWTRTTDMLSSNSQTSSYVSSKVLIIRYCSACDILRCFSFEVQTANAAIGSSIHGHCDH